MRYELKYGSGYLNLDLHDGVRVDVFEPRDVPALADPAAALVSALNAPVGCPPLKAQPAPVSLAIAVPDETRPVPLKTLLPPLIDYVLAAWPTLRQENIAIVVGGGLHPPADAAQLERILPESARACRIVVHDAENSPVISFGVTSRGTPVEINAEFGWAQYRMVVGMVDAHQFVGFTGGAKGVTIGCASAAMITANHSMMHSATAYAGNIADNPVRLDLNEAGQLAGVNLAVNVVMDAAKRPAAILAGAPHLVMREVSAKTAELYGLSFKEPYDIVVASCGGLPKDICLYQAQKGLSSATACAAPGAHIVLLAKCEQGIGDDHYYNYVRQFKNDSELVETFSRGPFRMGAHKAFLFARATTRFDVCIHSDLPEATLAGCLLRPGRIQEAVDAWLKEKPAARVAIIKSANSSFFCV
ncbi:MAG: nickel-dependent lactate racemase [Desulfovibrio sp.]|jgi:nickel-dependent lactate racemase|nr:nickel-dependent lactate racemase [Desulfovibrio sp.]